MAKSKLVTLDWHYSHLRLLGRTLRSTLWEVGCPGTIYLVPGSCSGFPDRASASTVRSVSGDITKERIRRRPSFETKGLAASLNFKIPRYLILYALLTPTEDVTRLVETDGSNDPEVVMQQLESHQALIGRTAFSRFFIQVRSGRLKMEFIPYISRGTSLHRKSARGKSLPLLSRI